MEIRDVDASLYAVGDDVVLVGSLTQGLKATWWAYVLPLLLIFVSVVMANVCAWNDAASAGLALAVLVVYYSIMYTQRSRFESRFAFTIEK